MQFKTGYKGVIQEEGRESSPEGRLMGRYEEQREHRGLSRVIHDPSSDFSARIFISFLASFDVDDHHDAVHVC